VEQRIVIKFLVGENVPSAEIQHRLQQQYGEESRVSCSEILYFTHRLYLWLLFRIPNKQQLFSYTKLSSWFL